MTQTRKRLALAGATGYIGHNLLNELKKNMMSSPYRETVMTRMMKTMSSGARVIYFR
ncbi:hypothetical protein [Exiguobacterium artemiae]